MNRVTQIHAKAASLILAAFLLCTGCANGPSEFVARSGGYSLTWKSNPSDDGAIRATVEWAGVDSKTIALLRADASQDSIRKAFAVYVEQPESKADTPPMLGGYQIAEHGVVFTPAYPLSHGVMYRAVLRPSQLPGGSSVQDLTLRYRPPEPGRKQAIVQQIYPSGDAVPENLLKFYVYFSAPMSRGGIYQHIHLRPVGGTDVELPFLELGEELWNPQMTRVTLLIDPGRIKRGVTPLEEIGPALVEGKQYDLIIDRNWQDAAGRPLKQAYRKRFAVGPADRSPIDPSKWNITAPRAGTREPLTVDFDGPLDQALASRMIQLKDASGNAIEGAIALENHETRGTFTPTKPWIAGTMNLTIDATLEDLAGNNIGKAFDVDTFEDVQRQIVTDHVAIPISIR